MHMCFQATLRAYSMLISSTATWKASELEILSGTQSYRQDISGQNTRNQTQIENIDRNALSIRFIGVSRLLPLRPIQAFEAPLRQMGSRDVGRIFDLA